MMPITPNGMRIRPTMRSLGRFHMRVTSPTGSGRAATSRRPSAMDFILPSSSISRSSMAAESPFFSPASRSCRFSSMRWGALLMSAMAMFINRSFLAVEESLAMTSEAWRASSAIFLIFSAMVIGITSRSFITYRGEAALLKYHEVVPVDDLVPVTVAQDLLNLPALVPQDLRDLPEGIVDDAPGKLAAVRSADPDTGAPLKLTLHADYARREQ